MTTQNFELKTPLQTIKDGEVTWQSPSNIALVKYWGKKDNQIPANPSISFTLSNCKTITTLSYTKSTTNALSFDVVFEGKPNDAFKPKITTFFKRIAAYLPFINQYHFTITTNNTFPHSSGIASSASGMSALALCLMSLEYRLTGKSTEDLENDHYFNNKASFLARLGSGSACRSIKGQLVVWGETPSFPESSNMFGVTFKDDVHPNFKNYQDAILLVDKGEKQVSSTVGHQLMHNHAYATQRFSQAHTNIAALKAVLINGDLKRFIEIVESEALTLHAMMMTSIPYFILMKPNTLKIINKIWEFRANTQSHICFTLDAGANVHILFPEKEKENIYQFINNELVAYCQNGQYICDMVGNGANQI